MTTRSVLKLSAVWLAGVLLAGAALAQPASDLTGGEVKKIDKAQKKITLKHEEIKSMDMPPMTMVFQVSDAQFLEPIKVGDKVLFQAERRDGAMVITKLQPTSTSGK
jgi:Cu(I)/Ag(I) efflux system protein CusF